MERLIILTFVTAACSYAGVACASPYGSDTPNGVTGQLNYSAGSLTVGGTISGCLAAATSPGSPVELTTTGGLVAVNSVSYPNGPFVASGYIGSSPLTVTYSVTESSAGVYLYTYDFTNINEISHIVLGVGNGCTTPAPSATLVSNSSNCVYSLNSTGSMYSPSITPGFTGVEAASTIAGSGANPALTAQGWTGDALEVQTGQTGGSFSVSFDSSLAPVWQNIYIRDGSTNNEAYNDAAADLFVLAPGIPLPEPAFFGLVAFGLLALYITGRRRKPSSIS